MSLMSQSLSKELICKYYNDYVFSKTELEDKLKKTDDQIKALKDYCESKETVDKEKKSALSKPSVSRSRSKRIDELLKDKSLSGTSGTSRTSSPRIR